MDTGSITTRVKQAASIVQPARTGREWTEANTARCFYARTETEKGPYRCPECREERPYTVTELPFGRERFRYQREACACERAAAELAEQERRRKQAEASRLQRIERANLSGKLARMSLDTLDMVPGLELAVERARMLIEAGPGSGLGLVLQGPFGCGKTHIAAAIGMAFIEQGHAVAFSTGADILQRIRQSYDGADPTGDVCGYLGQVPLLIYDDMGNERIDAGPRGDWAREQLFRVFNARETMELSTIITTNLEMPQLADSVGDAVVSRIFALCGPPVLIEAPDYRPRLGKGRWEAAYGAERRPDAER